MVRSSLVLLVSLLLAAFLGGCSNHAPAFYPIGNKAVETGKTLEFDVRAVDDDGDPLLFGIEGKPAAAVFENVGDNSARFSWTPIASDAGPEGKGQDYSVTFKVTDGIDVATETVLITVTLGGAGTGSPVFISPPDYSLDLDRTDAIQFSIEVRDADSATVTLRQVDNIDGGQFSITGQKTASFSWQPTDAQIAERPVWSMRVGADDGSNPEVFQDITILLKGGQKKCDGTPPTIEHQPLSDQRGSGDYPVTAKVTDQESAIGSVALYYLVDTGGGNTGTLAKKAMTPSGTDTWQATIPNPNLQQGQTARVSYNICAVDQDDPTGTCDQRACSPADGRYSFTAYPAGTDPNQCQNDTLEPNDDTDSATAVQFNQQGECDLSNLKICPGDSDWFTADIPANFQIGALIAFSHSNGSLQIDLYDEDGTSLLAQGQVSQDNPDQVIVASDIFPQAKTVYLRVYGGSTKVENAYQLVVIDLEACPTDSFDPDDTPDQAKVVTPGTYDSLAGCVVPDWFKVQLHQKDKLRVEILFSNSKGDLDLAVFDEQALSQPQLTCQIALGCSATEADNEVVQVDSIPADGVYYIAVVPYQNARNTYQMKITVTPGSGCSDDTHEPNNSPAAATNLDLFIGTPITGLVLCPNDEDWYKVYMYVGETLVIDMNFVNANGDLDLKLYDPDVTPSDLVGHLVASSQGVTNNEHISYQISREAYYYFQVYSYNKAGNPDYSLEVTIQ